MQPSNVSRRNFSKLTMSALGGVVAGTTVAASTGFGAQKVADGKKADLHACRGLNSCAGTSMCATAAAHTCAGQNDCKGQGGCGSNAGHNDCKGQGKCAVPMKDRAWKTARALFESRMKQAKKPFGSAPSKPKKT